MPYDLPGAVRRFLKRVEPRLAVIFETELWPNLYRECGRRRVPLVLASARVSERSRRPLSAPGRAVPRRAVAGLDRRSPGRGRRRALPRARRRCRQHPRDRQSQVRLRAAAEDLAERGRRLRSRYAPARALWVAGSTHDGRGGGRARGAAAGAQLPPRGAAGLAPRHPPRFAQVAQQLAQAGMRFARRSDRAVRVPPPHRCRSCCSTRSASSWSSMRRRTSPSSAGAWCPSAATTCSSPPRSGCRSSPVPTTSTARKWPGCSLRAVPPRSCTARSELGARVERAALGSGARERIGAQGRASVDGQPRRARQDSSALIEPLL